MSEIGIKNSHHFQKRFSLWVFRSLWIVEK